MEVAFAGRSNAGKSSVLNALSGRRALARVSKTPGRTREINFFQIDAGRRFADLPGYGFAQVPAAVKAAWGRLMESYFHQRRSLRGVVLVMDIRHPLTEFDQHMLAWSRERALAVHILLTKADKLSRSRAQASLHQIQAQLKKQDLPNTVQIFSALKRTGVEDLHARLDNWFGCQGA